MQPKGKNAVGVAYGFTDRNADHFIRLTRVEDLDDYVERLIHQAARQAQSAGIPVEPRSIIRVMDGPKRRPKLGA